VSRALRCCGGTREQLADFPERDIVTWRSVVKNAGITAE